MLFLETLDNMRWNLLLIGIVSTVFAIILSLLTGIGMSPDVVERVFDPFFTTKDTGTGLGLAVAKRFLENHSATIECLSEEGKGTTFAISLPITQRNTISE